MDGDTPGSIHTSIIAEISTGVEIFDKDRPTCLATDWSKTGLGFWLFQKHCNCPSRDLFCCLTGWKITLVGSTRQSHDTPQLRGKPWQWLTPLTLRVRMQRPADFCRPQTTPQIFQRSSLGRHPQCQTPEPEGEDPQVQVPDDTHTRGEEQDI